MLNRADTILDDEPHLLQAIKHKDEFVGGKVSALFREFLDFPGFVYTPTWPASKISNLSVTLSTEPQSDPENSVFKRRVAELLLSFKIFGCCHPEISYKLNALTTSLLTGPMRSLIEEPFRPAAATKQMLLEGLGWFEQALDFTREHLGADSALYQRQAVQCLRFSLSAPILSAPISDSAPEGQRRSQVPVDAQRES
ncbi:hypothetical protein OIV83_006210 [Microbotryomycetes sp. JL201]|nr:hypothetical protein OIV83_006210 [Microbotryomycetes sp. JL201]